jgi:hypothetical protein
MSAFEKWYAEYFGRPVPPPHVIGNHMHVQDAWQAAYRAALENAIRRCQSCEMTYARAELEAMYREAGGDVEQLQAQIDARFLSLP